MRAVLHRPPDLVVGHPGHGQQRRARLLVQEPSLSGLGRSPGRAAKAAEARLLNEKPGAPLLTMTRVAYDEVGRAVEYGSHLYRASMYTFELTLTTT